MKRLIGLFILVAALSGQPAKSNRCAPYLALAKERMKDAKSSYWLKSSAIANEDVSNYLIKYLECQAE